MLSGWRSYSRRPIGLDSYAVPRVYPSPWPVAPSPLAVETVAPRAMTPLAIDPHGTVRTLKTPYITQLPQDAPLNLQTTTTQFNGAPANGGGTLVATSPVPPKFDWEERLFENYHVGVHRVIFLVRRFPALAAFIAAIWVYFGRNGAAGFDLLPTEKNQNITVFVTTLASLVGVMLGVRNHSNDHKSAMSQIVFRLSSLFTSLVGEITAIVFGLIAIIKLGKQTEPVLPTCYPEACFSLNDRIVQSGVQLGLTLLSAILTTVSIFHGIQAIVRIFYDRKLERRSKWTFIVAVLAFFTDIIIAIAGLYVYKFQDSDRPLVKVFPNSEDENYNALFVSALPIIAAVFATVLCFGNRMRLSITYIPFIICALSLWNLLIAGIIYYKLSSDSSSSESSVNSSDKATPTQTYIYANALIFFAIELIVIVVFVVRGFRYLLIY
ncbi:hypothetical protein M3Y94_00864200 [Aphelenchoides besseyi]|nr:hypothetical protein M3Y94_00864200 [Aphelenchoides besseyi]